MSEELKACPFCGKPAERSMDGVFCHSCLYEMGGYWALSEELWNTRPLEDAIHKRLKEMTYERDAYQFALLGQESPLKNKLDIAVEALKYYYDNAEVGVGLGGDVAYNALAEIEKVKHEN
jgi:hypothetical protein